MGFVSGNHLLLFIVFLVIVLVIFGPGKLPDVGAGMGRAINEFRRASADVKTSLSPVAAETARTPAHGDVSPTQRSGDAGSAGMQQAGAIADHGA